MAEDSCQDADDYSIATLVNLCVESFDYVRFGPKLLPHFEMYQMEIDIVQRRLDRWRRAAGVNTDPRFAVVSTQQHVAAEVKRIADELHESFQILSDASERYKLAHPHEGQGVLNPKNLQFDFMMIHRFLVLAHQDRYMISLPSPLILHDRPSWGKLMEASIRAANAFEGILPVEIDRRNLAVEDVEVFPTSTLYALMKAPKQTDEFLFETTRERLLGMAIRFDEPDLLQHLIANGVNTNRLIRFKDDDLSLVSRFSIRLAIEHSPQFVKQLLEAGANPDLTFGSEGTALQFAIASGLSEQAEMLFDQGAKANAEPGAHGTALQAAVRAQDQVILRRLLQAGIDVNHIDDSGQTAIDLASDLLNWEAVTILQAHDSDSITHGDSAERILSSESSTELNMEGPEGEKVASQEEVIPVLSIKHDRRNVNTSNVMSDNHESHTVIPVPYHFVLPQRPSYYVSRDRSVMETIGPRQSSRHSKQWTRTSRVLIWGVPELIQKHIARQGTANLDIDFELILTMKTSPAKPVPWEQPRNGSGVKSYRACTWGELYQEELHGKCPELRGFLEGLVQHMLSIPINTDSGEQPIYIHRFGDGTSRIEVICYSTTAEVRAAEVNHVANSRFLHGLELLCMALLPSSDTSTRLGAAKRLPSHEVAMRSGGSVIATTRDMRHERFDSPLSKDFPDCNALPEWRLPETDDSSGCWRQLFIEAACPIVNLGRQSATMPPSGKGLEVSFDLMATLAAVEFPLTIDGGVVFVGYQTILVPVLLNDDFAQFHLITSTTGGLIDPFTCDLGKRLRTEDHQQFRTMRCFLGWCEAAVINLGTKGLPAKVKYARGVTKSQSPYMDALTVSTQLGVGKPSPVTLTAAIQAQFKMNSHKVQFTRNGGYLALLHDTAVQTALIYDSARKRGWVVPKLSLLVHMSQAYVLKTRNPAARVPFVERHVDALSLIGLLERHGNDAVLSGETHELLFCQLLLRLNEDLCKTVKVRKASSRKTLYGLEMMDVARPPDREVSMRSLKLSSSGKRWIKLANIIDAVVVCSHIGEVITAIPSNNTVSSSHRQNHQCNSLPENRDYLAATISCLRQLEEEQESDSDGEPGELAQQTKLLGGLIWEISEAAFDPCKHKQNSNKTCWNRKGHAQRIKAAPLKRPNMPWGRGEGSKSGIIEATVKVPPNGAAVFG